MTMTAMLKPLLAICFGQPIKTRASYWLARLGPMVVLALLFGFGQTRAQAPSVAVSGVDAALIEDIVIGSRVLADFGVLDGFGHVSARHPTNPNHFLMSRSLAPALVTADDIMEFDLDGNAVGDSGRSVFLERFIHSEIYKARPDDKSVVLMRGHGDVTVGPSVKVAVFRAYYTDVNARLQSQAIALGGDVNYLTPGEGAKADTVNLAVLDRIWNLWRMRIAPSLAK